MPCSQPPVLSASDQRSVNRPFCSRFDGSGGRLGFRGRGERIFEPDVDANEMNGSDLRLRMCVYALERFSAHSRPAKL